MDWTITPIFDATRYGGAFRFNVVIPMLLADLYSCAKSGTNWVFLTGCPWKPDPHVGWKVRDWANTRSGNVVIAARFQHNVVVDITFDHWVRSRCAHDYLRALLAAQRCA